MALLQTARVVDEPARLQALEALLIELYPRVVRYVTARVTRGSRSEALAEDVAQETLFLVLRHLDQCHATSDEQLVTWVLTIARRTGIAMLREQATRLMVQSFSEAYEQGMAAAAWRNWLDEVEDELTPEDRRIMVLVMQEYEQLPTDTMELLFLHLVEGRSWPEVADRFGSTHTAVKRRCQRALQRLRNRVIGAVRRLPPAEQRLLGHLTATAWRR